MRTKGPVHRVAFFGGTFDPVHLGHLEIATKAKRALQLDELVFLPCKQSPHKDTRPTADDESRLRFLTLATQDLTWARVSDFELRSPPPSYTWKTLSTLIPAYHQKCRPFLLIGLDQWESLPRWAEPEMLAEMVEFIVVGRDGCPTPRPGYRAHFLRGDHPASSSAIRQALAEGASPESQLWLPQKIRTDLASSGLYQK